MPIIIEYLFYDLIIVHVSRGGKTELHIENRRIMARILIIITREWFHRPLEGWGKAIRLINARNLISDSC